MAALVGERDYDRRMVPPTEIESHEDLERWIAETGSLRNTVVQNVNLAKLWSSLEGIPMDGAVFLGCDIPAQALVRVVEAGAVVFPRLDHGSVRFPFNQYRARLYSPEELLAADDDEPKPWSETLDHVIYQHWLDNGRNRPKSIRESLARRLHDHAITDALDDYLTVASEERKCVAIMGGHSLARSTDEYFRVVEVAHGIAARGYTIVTGGGPGAMEAGNLGAAAFRVPLDELRGMVARLAEKADRYDHPDWLTSAVALRRVLMDRVELAESVGVPTWMYGHEPPNPFATAIAKYFANSVREEGLLAIAHHGVIFERGSAGTLQEVFQDLTQNYYQTYGDRSPMVFLGSQFWRQERPAVDLVQSLARAGGFTDLVRVTDSADETVAFLTEKRSG